MKKMLMVLLMLCLMGAGSAMAESVSFIKRDWDAGNLDVTEEGITIDNYKQLTGSPDDYVWGNEWVVVMPGETVIIDDQVSVPVGTVNLVLCDGANLIVRGGIELQKERTQLRIYGQGADSGTLTAQITTYGQFSSVWICGGTVNASVGDSNKAAIGGGYAGTGVTILGGTVNATNAGTGAAIGGDADRDCTVMIMGGTVNATNNGTGAAINRNVLIYGGDITAKGGKGMPGVGDGNGDVIIYGRETDVLMAQYGVEDAANSSENQITWGEPVVYDTESKNTPEMSANAENGKHGWFRLWEGSIPDEDPVEDPVENPAKNPAADLPQTGDPSSLLGWVCLLAASGAGLKIRRKK